MSVKSAILGLNRHIVCLQKGLVLAKNSGESNRNLVLTVQANLMNFGYIFEEKAIDALSLSSKEDIVAMYESIVNYLNWLMGGKTTFTPLYKNFPTEVMSKSDCGLYFNSLRHFWSKGKWEPAPPEFQRDIKFEKVKTTTLKLATEAEFLNIFTSLVSINTSLTPSDMEVVKWFVETKQELVMPKIVPFKENLCVLAAMGLDVPVKTTTDVLRIAVHMSGGDTMLPKVPKKTKKGKYGRVEINEERENFKFRKFSRAERKLILNLLEKTHCSPEEMVLKDQRWIRLGEILHPGDYKHRFPKCYAAFSAIRNTKVVSWYGKVDASFKKNFKAGLKTLAERPGEYARKIDYLLRTGDSKEVIQAFSTFSENISNKVLFELYINLEKRLDGVTGRKVFIKGARKPATLPDLPPLDAKIVFKMQEEILIALQTKFSKLDPLGKVWIDSELLKIPLPSNMRTLNLSMAPTVRGQRTPFDNPDAKVIRPFVHWVDKEGNEDLDLSATFVGKSTVQVLNFRSLKVGKSVHSGDVIGRKGNCAEYIDIDMADALKLGFQYVVLDVRNYRQGSLESVDCSTGIMEREHPQANKLWLPETLASAQLLRSSSVNTMISILDLQAKEYIFLDIDSDGNTAHGDVKAILATINQYATAPKFSVYHLLELHAKARGTLVREEEAHITFRYEDFSKSYEKTGEYMGI